MVRHQRVINRHNCCAISRNLNCIPCCIDLRSLFRVCRVHNSWSALMDGLDYLLQRHPHPLFFPVFPASSLPIYSVVIISRLSRNPTETSSGIHKFLGRIRGILQQQIPEISSKNISEIHPTWPLSSFRNRLLVFQLVVHYFVKSPYIYQHTSRIFFIFQYFYLKQRSNLIFVYILLFVKTSANRDVKRNIGFYENSVIEQFA